MSVRGLRTVWVGVMLMGACGGDALGPGDVVRVAVVPSSARLRAAGDSVRFALTAHRSDGSSESVAASWSSSLARVVEVQADGWAVARDTGVARVDGMGMGMTASAVVLVSTDTTPPLLVGLFADPTVVVARRPATIRVRVDFEDEALGRAGPLGIFDGPLGAGVSNLVTFEELPADSAGAPGDPGRARVAFEGFLPIPSYAGTGVWTLIDLRMEDRVGNARQWDADDLRDAGLTLEIRSVPGG